MYSKQVLKMQENVVLAIGIQGCYRKVNVQPVQCNACSETSCMYSHVRRRYFVYKKISNQNMPAYFHYHSRKLRQGEANEFNHKEYVHHANVWQTKLVLLP